MEHGHTEAPGQTNIVASWWMIGIGMAFGGILGLWSFGGPVPPPAGLARYNDLPRRLLRLAHVAAIALPALNLVYVPWVARSTWNAQVRRIACRLLLFGTLALPCLLAATAFWPLALYALPAPALALVTTFFLLAAGLIGTRRDGDEEGQPCGSD